MEPKIYSVSEINVYIKSLLDRDARLSSVCVRGEISNYKVYPSGHHYFTLKDPEGSIRCVMFKSSASRLRFRPENGMKVLVTGRISVFPRDGGYQLYSEFMMPEGAGDLHVAFEQLKARLQAEGLFDSAHKKPVPRYPERIAIITSSAGAAIHDMLRIIGQRYPLSKVILLPVRVQGVEAPPEICGAIRYVNRFQLADVIITGRGGGSMEDLWAFNDERVAYEIYRSDIPLISAVGHEPDVTISDFVADLRAATPSNAAELVVPDQAELRQVLRSMESRMGQAVSRQLKMSRQALEGIKNKRVLQSPLNYIQDKRMILDFQQKQLNNHMHQSLSAQRQRFVRLVSGLDAMSPLKVLARGYSMTKNEKGHVIIDASAVQPGDLIHVTLHQGQIDATVITSGGKKHEE